MARLTKLVQSGRRVTAEILMHLAEIEDRRLHLKAGYNSLFAYCLAVHGMSEDEACRRIEVARLGRQFKPIFGLLASGALSLSVAALLKDCLTDQNQASLLAAVSGKSVRAAREELAARFPIPEVPSSIRKLPQRATVAFGSGATLENPPSTRDIAGNLLELSAPPTSTRELTGASAELSLSAGSTRDIAGALTESSSHPNSTRDIAGGICVHPTSTCDIAEAPRPFGAVPSVKVTTPDARRAEGPSEEAEPLSELDDSARARGRAVNSVATTFRAPTPRTRIEPLSSARYRVQFTADLAQKQKLELALDLMSHRNPNRDLATVVERGLDLLIEELLRTRTGKTSRPHSEARQCRKERVSSATRRLVVKRDGLRCSFVDERGRRCEGRAFLEFDHEQPLGKDGGSEPINVRLLCRAHNRYCAELEYGRAKVDREIARSKNRRGATPDSVRE